MYSTGLLTRVWSELKVATTCPFRVWFDRPFAVKEERRVRVNLPDTCCAGAFCADVVADSFCAGAGAFFADVGAFCADADAGAGAVFRSATPTVALPAAANTMEDAAHAAATSAILDMIIHPLAPVNCFETKVYRQIFLHRCEHYIIIVASLTTHNFEYGFPQKFPIASSLLPADISIMARQNHSMHRVA